MNYLTLENVSKSYGEKVLFSDITLHINKGDKVALVAKNGTGKTSLLRVIAGEEAPEGVTANIQLARGIKSGYLRQEPLMSPERTVMETVFDSDNEVVRAIKDYEFALLRPNDAEGMQKALEAMERLKAWDFESQIKEILFKLNITDLEQKVGTLSGGQRKRIALAKLLVEDPEFIIMDEPTNHLDIEMIEWLEEYLSGPNVTLFMVTHDRYFLERVCNVIVELEHGNLYKYSGNYTDFLVKKTTRNETEGIEKEKAKKLMKKELVWLGRQPKARTTKAKSRINAFDAIEEKATMDIEDNTLHIDLKGARLGSKILECHYISKSFGDKVIVKDFDYKFKKNERVGIVGKNGMGKTTLLNLMTKTIRPDSGKVVVGGTVQFGYYGQEGIEMKDDKRIIDVITDIAEYIPLEKGHKLTAGALLERFMFDRKHQQVYVSQLSGGEKRRLYLLTVLMQNPNFLILDEPTNDLDIVTLNVLEEWLLSFQGCVIIVSHDRFFMDKLVDHLFIMEGEGKVRDYNGSYRAYREIKKLEDREARKGEKENEEKKLSKHEQIHAAQGGLTHEQKKELKRVERKVESLEKKKAEISAKFSDPEITPEQIGELGKELAKITEELEEQEMRWMELAEMA